MTNGQSGSLFSTASFAWPCSGGALSSSLTKVAAHRREQADPARHRLRIVGACDRLERSWCVAAPDADVRLKHAHPLSTTLRGGRRYHRWTDRLALRWRSVP